MRILKCGLGLLMLLLTGCATQYSISESEVEDYLNNEMHYEVSQGNQVFGLQLKLNDMEVELGHKPNTIAVTAQTRMAVKNPFKSIEADLVTTFEAELWYDVETKSIYLKKLDLVEVKSTPADIEKMLSSITPQLMMFLSTFLASQPVYVLDENDANQALMASITKEIEVQKGKIVIKF
ncbi:DUF1439 domain-containing protein [Shewanella sp. 10N.286.48.A6]|uniref:DUF1439 domain-containing protein n=1 Tax=Shewanella sp. 10N.286.48.A6 TaxID=1880833 RepID=UPI000C830782|nr:DUF1439 domain-containing protein [Shewanella sp. 10N.286.48.A6]PMI01912.1 hypothetical protein BCU55_09565 [Shewanella sp. 10N.286.48.A6]